jgi:hypothetical protein
MDVVVTTGDFADGPDLVAHVAEVLGALTKSALIPSQPVPWSLRVIQ